jgi:hypothetical protein
MHVLTSLSIYPLIDALGGTFRDWGLDVFIGFRVWFRSLRDLVVGVVG